MLNTFLMTILKMNFLKADVLNKLNHLNIIKFYGVVNSKLSFGLVMGNSFNSSFEIRHFCTQDAPLLA